MHSTTAILTSMLLQLMCLAAVQPVLQASGVAAPAAAGGDGGIMRVPSNDSLAHCPSSCGDAKFYYPFGTAPGCFRQGFELTCDNATQPPRLFWGNSTTEILGTDGTDHYFAYASIGFNVTMTPGTDTYKRSWSPPAKGFTIDSDNQLYVVGCDVEATLLDMDTNRTIGSCTSTCKGDRATMEKDQAAVGHCNGSGCCSIGLPDYMRGFQFTLARRGGITARSDAVPSTVKVFLSDQYEFDTKDLYSSWINKSSIHTSLEILVTDQPSCKTASANKATYACTARSLCQNVPFGGYFCYCNPRLGAGGNPYILDGCNEA